jgi:hypothetical protein
MPRFTVQPSDQVKQALADERAELARSLPRDPQAFANDPRVMAFMALNNSIENELAYWPRFFSSDAGDKDTTLRYSNVYWWRLIIRYPVEGNIIQVLYLVRLTEPKPSVAHTIKEMN